jgi:hypothetical protein
MAFRAAHLAFEAVSEVAPGEIHLYLCVHRYPFGLYISISLSLALFRVLSSSHSSLVLSLAFSLSLSLPLFLSLALSLWLSLSPTHTHHNAHASSLTPPPHVQGPAPARTGTRALTKALRTCHKVILEIYKCSLTCCTGTKRMPRSKRTAAQRLNYEESEKRRQGVKWECHCEVPECGGGLVSQACGGSTGTGQRREHKRGKIEKALTTSLLATHRFMILTMALPWLSTATTPNRSTSAKKQCPLTATTNSLTD